MCRHTLFFFFFKQKTADEMRISDWSSDVCSSDLSPAGTDSRAGTDEIDDRGGTPAARLGTGCNGRLIAESCSAIEWAGGIPRPDAAGDTADRAGSAEIGRASCRERVWQDV